MDSQDELKLTKKTTDYVAILTLVLVLGYLAGAIYSLMDGTSSFKEFSAAIGPLAGTMLGYWVRGRNIVTSSGAS